MPQLSQLDTVFLSQLFWLFLVLGIIYFFVGRGIVPKVEETVDARDAKIESDLAEAERLREQADATEEAWRGRMNEAHAEAQANSAAAKAKADIAAQKRVAKADAAIAVTLQAAEAELASARTNALAEIDGIAAESAQDIVAKLTGSKVTKAQAKKAVAEALSYG